MRSGVLAGMVLVIGWLQADAWAQTTVTTAASHEVPRLTVGGTVLFGTVLGSLCAPTTGDVISCGADSTVAGLRLSPRWRLSNDWAVGISGGVAWLGRGGNVPTKLWDIQFTGRYHLGATTASQYWLDASAGLVAVEEDWPTYVTDSGMARSATTYSTWAPAGSLAIGRDVQILHFFGVAPEIRVHCLGFNVNDEFPNTAPQYRPQVIVVLGLSLVGLGFYR
jgi:hypothetical protein